MITRRGFLGALSAVSASSLIPVSGIAQKAEEAASSPTPAPAPSSEDVTKFVKIAIGTGGHGHTYPGATVPFGMVQLSPDTFDEGWDWCSGYHYSDSSIMGFSHTHLSGTGAADMLDFLLMPGTGPDKIFPGARENPGEGYRSRFHHADEIAEVGYYSVLLRDYNIRAELSATERAGIHRYTFPASDASYFILDLHHRSSRYDIAWSEVKIVGDDTIVGGRGVNGWAPGRQIYFAMKFSKPFASSEIVSEDKKLDTSVKEAKSKSLKCLLHYKTGKGEVILVKVGLSGVSNEGAMKNLEAEIPGWDFEKVRHDAHKAWQRELSRIRITTNNLAHKEIFYTSLYHTKVAPTLFDDADGQYRGMDGEVHRLPKGLHNYSTFSIWDTFRAAHPLFTIALPERVPDFVNCLIRMAQESPAGMPVWPLQGKETGCMTGYHSSAVIAEALAKGFPDIDFKKVYPAVRQRAMVDDYRGLGHYRKLGFIPCDKEEESVSKAMEYIYDDWAVAHVAQAVGAADDAKLLLERSRNYRNLFDAKVGFIRPRLENGDWAEPFDPTEMGYSKKWRDYTESNPWETTFSVQHDPKGYMQLFGGREAFIEKLDALFSVSPSFLPMRRRTSPEWLGNTHMEMSLAITWRISIRMREQRGKRRSVSATCWRWSTTINPDGLAGNEDCGQMSAWYVISALGFYAVDPVSGNYVFGTPLFDRAEVDMGDGKRLIVEAKRRSPTDQYIQSVKFNGKPHEKVWFRHADIANGATIIFTMGSEPNKQFGAEESAAPPSLTA